MKCKKCKYKNNIANTEETGSAICLYSNSWFLVHLEDDCHYIPENVGLTCGDCTRLREDSACIGGSPEDSAEYDGKLCAGFIDKREEELRKILMFWKVQGLYEREKINELIDEFEKLYASLAEQE